MLACMTDKATQWSERVAAWRASGKSAVAFAAEHGVAEATLRWWARQLRGPAPPGSRPRGRPPKPPSAPVVLARVVRPGELPPAALQPPISVIIGDARVLVGPGADEASLRAVFRALGSAR
jgi:hypothetical protein